jgi:HAD superfamily hydrolase (TIGR01458 family)
VVRVGDTTGLLIDIDGVLVVSWAPLPGAVDALSQLRRASIPLCFLTNTTSKTRAQMTVSLREAGFEVDDDEILTAAAATASYLTERHAGARCLLLNSGDITDDLEGIDLITPAELVGGPRSDARPVDVVVIGGAGVEFDYDSMNVAFRALMGGASLVAMLANTIWQTNAGLQLDAGAYVAALERASGRHATVIGKPSTAMFDAGVRYLGVEAAQVAMVGDDLDSDVRGAQAAGLTGVQVRTGKFRPEQLLGDGVAADVVLDSFADVPRWLDLQPS